MNVACAGLVVFTRLRSIYLELVYFQIFNNIKALFVEESMKNIEIGMNKEIISKDFKVYN